MILAMFKRLLSAPQLSDGIGTLKGPALASPLIDVPWQSHATHTKAGNNSSYLQLHFVPTLNLIRWHLRNTHQLPHDSLEFARKMRSTLEQYLRFTEHCTARLVVVPEV